MWFNTATKREGIVAATVRDRNRTERKRAQAKVGKKESRLERKVVNAQERETYGDALAIARVILNIHVRGMARAIENRELNRLIFNEMFETDIKGLLSTLLCVDDALVPLEDQVDEPSSFDAGVFYEGAVKHQQLAAELVSRAAEMVKRREEFEKTT
jgi:hypothetical protein